MAKSKVIVERGFNNNNIPCINVSCAKGKLNAADIDKALRAEEMYSYKLMYIQNITDDIADEMFDDGDMWTLYEPEDFYADAVAEAYNKGWEDCLKENGLD